MPVYKTIEELPYVTVKCKVLKKNDDEITICIKRRVIQIPRKCIAIIGDKIIFTSRAVALRFRLPYEQRTKTLFIHT